MRLFCELFLVAALVWLGWSQSFHDRINQVRGIEPTPAPQARQAVAATAPAPVSAPRQPFLPARPAPTASGDWMWDPAHRNPLDRAAYKTDTAEHQASPNYWIDSRGIRHPINSTPSP